MYNVIVDSETVPCDVILDTKLHEGKKQPSKKKKGAKQRKAVVVSAAQNDEDHYSVVTDLACLLHPCFLPCAQL